jgi:hypothetical protein
MKRIVFFFFVFFSTQLLAQKSNIPTWFIDAFQEHKLNTKYDLKGFIKPNLIQADFNGDGIEDIAALIIERKSGKKGILLILGQTKQYVIWGAGKPVGKVGVDSSDDLKWMGRWAVYKDKTAYETKFDNGDIVGSTKRMMPNKGISICSLEDNTNNGDW